MTDFSIEQLHDEFGARITGIDLKSPLTEDEVESIREMIDIYSFLCFPGQGLNDEQQLAFTKSLGEPEEEHVMLGQTGEEHIYSHQWQVGDFVIWDNRCLIHRGEGFDVDKHRRYMRQTRVCGLSSTLDE